MAHREPSHAAHDRLLVISVAGLILGVVLVCHGMPLAEPMPHVVPRANVVLTPAEWAGSAPGQRLAAPASPPDRVPSTPSTRIARSGATGLLGPCGPHFDLGHDLGQDLAAMAQQGRRLNKECPSGPSGTPATLGVPASVLVRAGGRDWLPVEVSPKAARLPTVPGG